MNEGESDHVQGGSAAEPLPVKLTVLKPVPITSVWPTEPYHFTPWLLKNADQLSELLGVDIELQAREYKIGKFSLDLLGEEVESGKPVIVENQFGATDHDHLGKMLTYAGGTKPATVIWIAETFRDEHRAALEWLNSSTTAEVRFFGIEVGATTLEGASPNLVAPTFDLVVQPNEWEKIAEASKSSKVAGTTVTQDLYQEFWTSFLEEAKPRGWTNATPPAANWWNLPSGEGSVTWGVSFTKFGCRSELYFGHPDPAVNFARWQVLEEQRGALQAAFGEEPLTFDPLPNNKACRVEARLLGPKVVDKACWTSTLDWLIETQVRLRAAVASVGGIPTVVPADSSDEP